MIKFSKNSLKFILILLLVILVCLSFLFLYIKKDKNKVNNNVLSQQNQNIIDQNKVEKNIILEQSATSTPVLLNNDEKKKYGINTDKPVYLEMIKGNKDFPGSLPRLILPPELTASSSYEVDMKKDTDQDGLPDFIELEKYKTDPKNPDTDGDGYKDGDEVKNGFNPNGSGKL